MKEGDSEEVFGRIARGIRGAANAHYVFTLRDLHRFRNLHTFTPGTPGREIYQGAILPQHPLHQALYEAAKKEAISQRRGLRR